MRKESFIDMKADQVVSLKQPGLEDLVTVIEDVEQWETSILVYSPKRRCNILVWRYHLDKITEHKIP